MVTPPRTLDHLNKVVVAYLDGRRLRGYVYNFSALKDSFHLFPQENPVQERGARVAMSDLKAIFFVKNFIGNREYRGQSLAEPAMHGRTIEVTFSDGEKIFGKTEGYDRQKLGFFMFPADPETNDLRIFVVNKNASQVRFV